MRFCRSTAIDADTRNGSDLHSYAAYTGESPKEPQVVVISVVPLILLAAKPSGEQRGGAKFPLRDINEQWQQHWQPAAAAVFLAAAPQCAPWQCSRSIGCDHTPCWWAADGARPVMGAAARSTRASGSGG